MAASGAEKFVLDTSALFCLKQDEEGAAEVESILEKAGKSGRVYTSFASWMEYFYVTYRELGRERAYRAYLELKMLPLHVVESEESLGLLAGELKATYPLSFADAWVAATAIQWEARLVHKDPEFELIGKRVPLHSLPYKKKQR